MSAFTHLNIDESRPELRGFPEHYAQVIKPLLAKNVTKARDTWLGAVALGVGGFATTLLIGWWMFRRYGATQEVVILTGVLLLFAGVLVWMKFEDLQKHVKKSLVPEVCRFFGFHYHEKVQDAGFEGFLESGLLPEHDRDKLEDHIRGSYQGVEFDLFECTLEARTGSGKDRSWKKVHHGVLFRFAFPKRFNGRTLVLKDAGLIGNFLKGIKASGEKIKLEDPRFEQQFEVWSNDPIEARYLLTPTFMERMVELARLIDSNRIEFCFRNNLLLVSAHVTGNQYEGGGLFTSVVDARRVESLVNEICRVFDIVNILQLQLATRI